MASSRQLISSQVLSGTAASVTFSSIPSTYTDLCVKFSMRASTDTSPSSCGIILNGDTTSGSATYLRETTGLTVVSLRRTATMLFDRFTDTASDQTANTFSNGEIYIPSYTATQNKPVSLFTVNEANVSDAPYSPNVAAGLSGFTGAVTSILLKNLSGDLAAGSSFYLYGIKNS